jgi:hypothetical protein
MAGSLAQETAEKKNIKLFEFRRPTDSWVRVHLRRFGEQNIQWQVLRSGDPVKGTVMFIVKEAEAAWSIFTQVRTVNDTVQWIRSHGTEPMSRQQADAYLHAATARDPDLWIIETDKAVMSQNDLRPSNPRSSLRRKIKREPSP